MLRHVQLQVVHGIYAQIDLTQLATTLSLALIAAASRAVYYN